MTNNWTLTYELRSNTRGRPRKFQAANLAKVTATTKARKLTLNPKVQNVVVSNV